MILLITRKYPPAVGGMETLSYQYTRHLAGRRACRVLSPHGLWSAQALFVVYALLKSTWLLFHGGIELIHLGDPILAPLGCLFWCLFHVPVACNAHGLDIVYPNRFYQALVVGSLRQLSLVICISQYARQECLRRGVPAARCVVIPPGIVVDEVAPEAGGASVIPAASRSGERYVLLTVGRLVRRKGVVEFIRHVLPRLLALRQDWVYWVVGDGPDLESARDECRRLGLGGYVCFWGRLGDAEVRGAYAQADLFVMPNIPVEGDAEGFGIVILEARAAGLPVLATDLEGIRDAWAGADGALVAPGEPQRFAEAISGHLAKATGAVRLRRWRLVQQAFGWPTVIEQYLAAFDALGPGSADAGRRTSHRRAAGHPQMADTRAR